MKKVISVCLSLLLLASSSGIAYAQHFCGEFEMMSKITFGAENLSCGMAMEIPDCDDEASEPECCDNQYTQVETDDTFVSSSFDMDFGVEFAITFAAVYVLKVVDIPTTEAQFFADTSPPPLEQDLYILHESYLI